MSASQAAVLASDSADGSTRRGLGGFPEATRGRAGGRPGGLGSFAVLRGDGGGDSAFGGVEAFGDGGGVEAFGGVGAFGGGEAFGDGGGVEVFADSGGGVEAVGDVGPALRSGAGVGRLNPLSSGRMFCWAWR